MVESQKIADHFGSTAEHPKYTEAIWVDYVCRRVTREGYWDWVAAEISKEAKMLNASPLNQNIQPIPSLRGPEHYKNTFIATVQIEGDSFRVLGGNKDKRSLKIAKGETDFCFVRNESTQQSAKLVLIEGDWQLANLDHT